MPHESTSHSSVEIFTALEKQLESFFANGHGIQEVPTDGQVLAQAAPPTPPEKEKDQLTAVLKK
ncbi:hypothetical protein KBJ94_28025 [Pseudomonas sp. ITA]|uniref:hypothetical protein n=1 Tax=Pseudomonas sp. ITA TaxID=2825841 RepID=UPI0024971A70|nr:hypothetical protein [Pseudomonas sp. ITA]MDI2145897.1 hypothetical protein [Pseudomonas sp. ITA]